MAIEWEISEFVPAHRRGDVQLLIHPGKPLALLVFPWFEAIRNVSESARMAQAQGYGDIVEVGNLSYRLDGLDTTDCDYYLLEGES